MSESPFLSNLRPDLIKANQLKFCLGPLSTFIQLVVVGGFSDSTTLYCPGNNYISYTTSNAFILHWERVPILTALHGTTFI